MSEPLTINIQALEPLFRSWEEPCKYRVRAEGGEGAMEKPGRRPSSIAIAQSLRGAVKEWRDNGYFGVSDTSRQLLSHWFLREHRDGERVFRYYFCQREAIETLIYLKEVRRIDCLSQLVEEFGGTNAQTAALGITDEEDELTRFAFKMATGTGKTKVMSLAIVWSYFHALRESDSPMAKHFVVIAPNLTVFERLKEDFKPEGGGPNIFDKDPLIPVEWRGDWNLTTVLQDEASGANTGGVLYLTNIHRLFDTSKRKGAQQDAYDWMGPAVSKAKALDTGEALRERITGHERIMVLNDEAHHVWDPDSAWNDAITFLNEAIRKRSGGGISAQLDFSATPKDNKANYFKNIVCDTPLGEAVDAGIVKTPIIGRVGNLVEQATADAAYRYEMHLKLGYERWKKSRDEWFKSGKKPLLFVMCEDTKAADEIARRLNGDPAFKELNGRTINLHTNLKGKVRKIGKGPDAREEFVESDKEISDEDLKALRKLSRELDSGSSPYFCIVSVLMLREGWDVRNVTTIVPLRPYSSKAGILPEQTLGRGLRRMTPCGQANEIVAVIEHEAFARLYREELAQEGLQIESIEVEHVPSTTVSIYPDPKKDATALEIAIPRLTAGNKVIPVLGPISEAEVAEKWKPFSPLPIGGRGPDDVQYEGRHLITNEIVEQMKVHLPLLESGNGAISFYVQELESICKIKGTHAILAPLLERFFEGMLFGPGQSIYDKALVARLSDSDVREHVRAVFVPLVRSKTTQEQVREFEAAPFKISEWRPFQVTVSERHPAEQSGRTIFNLVPCNRTLEQAFSGLCSRASDVAAFAKNAGPQCLRIDYLAPGSRLAFYTPDFFIRLACGNYCLVETKGQVDVEVPIKARAAVEWCKAASSKKCRWDYLFVQEGVFERFHGGSIDELARVCAPSLKDLLNPERFRAELPLFADQGLLEAKASESNADLFNPKTIEGLPERIRKAIEQSASLFRFLEKGDNVNYAPVFSALLGVTDESVKRVLIARMTPEIPESRGQTDWFEPYLDKVDYSKRRHYEEMARNLRKTLIYQHGVSPMGLLRSCLEYSLNDSTPIVGVFASVKKVFRFTGSRAVLSDVQFMNDLRNTKIAHQESQLTERTEAQTALVKWIEGLARVWQSVQ